MNNMTLSEKVAYLKGVLEGMNNDDKVIGIMADILRDMALEIEDQQDQIDEICEAVDSVSDDLEEMESDFYQFDEDDDDDDDFGDDDFDDDDYEDDDEDDELDDDDEELYETTCPTCGDTICINDAILAEGHINCPNCNELLEFDLEDGPEDADEE